MTSATVRLARWSLHAFRLPYTRPVRWSDIVEDGATFLLLRLESTDGVVGVGESTVKPTWAGFGVRSLAALVEDVMVPIVARHDLGDPAEVRRALEGVPEGRAAKALVDHAVHDLALAARGVGLRDRCAASVPFSWAVTRQTPAAMAREAAEQVGRQGFPTLKVKGGQGIDVDVRGMLEIRAAIGERVQLYVDANGFYTYEDALDFSRRMADAGAVVVEDPCPLLPDERFAALQSGCAVPILVDFPCASPTDAGLYLERGARAFSIKPGRVGPTHAAAMAALAREHGSRTTLGLFGESLLGTLAVMQTAPHLPDHALPCEASWFLEMTQQVLAEPPALTAGRLAMPDAPSLAALVNWEAVRHAALGPPLHGQC